MTSETDTDYEDDDDNDDNNDDYEHLAKPDFNSRPKSG